MLFCALAMSAVLTKGADAIIASPPADFAEDNGEGWYFREFEIQLGKNPDPLLLEEEPDSLLGVDPDLLRNFPSGSLSLIGQVATVNVICPRGYVSSGCIGGTVPPSISNIQFNGGISQELSGTLRGNVNAGFNAYTGCGTTVRFDYPIPRGYLRNSKSIFVKAEAYCKPISAPKPPPVDPCACKNRREPLGCTETNACASGAVCYVDQAGCPGFAASQNPARVGQFYKCVANPRREC